jgi:hypothetical protein
MEREENEIDSPPSSYIRDFLNSLFAAFASVHYNDEEGEEI